mgnify:CR=1 FL=1
MTYFRTILISILLSLVLAGCSLSDLPGLYRVEIQQGNIITKERLKEVKPGLTRQQVVFLLGSPSVVDPFHQDRWDYVFQILDSKYNYTTHKMALFFKDDALEKIEGTAAETDIVSELKTNPNTH